jgi:hypothetical protein
MSFFGLRLRCQYLRTHRTAAHTKQQCMVLLNQKLTQLFRMTYKAYLRAILITDPMSHAGLLHGVFMASAFTM